MGREAQKEKLICPLCAKENGQFARVPFTEPMRERMFAGYKDSGRERCADLCQIKRNKMFITNGTVCDLGDPVALPTPREETQKQFQSHHLFPADFAIGGNKKQASWKIGDTFQRYGRDPRWKMSACPTPTSSVKEGRGFIQLMHFFNTTGSWLRHRDWGLSEACLENEHQNTWKERNGFRGFPWAPIQLTQKKLTEMAIMIGSPAGACL